ncbi:MAG: DUF2283 domain-containing protein [Chlorobiaceae bacterium]|nr:DUF2283 domain-containing protein [Chlorobiaceae bacterium]
MEQVKVYYDHVGNTITVWLGDPKEEHLCEEIGDDVILMKDKAGKVIGFEKINFKVPAEEQMRIAFEAVHE